MAPLPPLPPESTRRAYIVYTSGGIEHTMTIRIPAGVSAGTLDDYLNEVIAAMVPIIDTTDTVIRVDESAAGSNIRFLLFPVGLNGTKTGNAYNDATRSAFVSITGKGSDGRLTAMSFYSLNASFFVDTRVPLGVVNAEYADFYNAVTQSSTGMQPRNIGGAIVGWKNYFNTAKSGYWQREQR